MHPIYLNLGCADHPRQGFFNIDLDAPGADLHLEQGKALPWERGTVPGIYSAHLLERLGRNQGIRLLHECRRVLQPGGVIRLVTTDLKALIDDYLSDRPDPSAPGIGRSERLNNALRQQAWTYDEAELTRICKMVGLEPLTVTAPGASSDPALSGLESAAPGQLVLEFRKPLRQLAADAEPLVSIVMPTYRTTYLHQAMESALNQTYRNLEILICDDCPTDAIKDITAEYGQFDSRIRYVRNPDAGKDIGRLNHLLCLKESRGEFIKFLNDDDLLDLECVERMIKSFTDYPDITLVTSKRQRIDEHGVPLPDIAATRAPVASDSMIEGLSLGTALMQSYLNFVGEPTTVMFRRSEVIEVTPNFLSVDEQDIPWAPDVAIFINLALKGNTVYLIEPLSSFRHHAEQCQVLYAGLVQEESRRCWDIMRDFWIRHEFDKSL
ncbi:glycosyltransferase [Pseudomonas sp. 5P_5.1_Bac1]|uniref:glycosyltransferase n=1 Tax=Pseudomonas sp. 5P_5.1_Bac1 TaxID=2971616 RepID=UPI0021C60C3A|nr:glycosyltransferase [Pseudomonas sp. 5P_5.1_Bac1]MCU1722458.1 glycosyltransferase [Pseudomonas sp. 5P_5.1_Bac1]